MDDKTSIDQEYEDLYLPLFGQHSIVGRSVVIHKKVGGGRWVCANIAYPGPVTTAVAEFDGFAQGNASRNLKILAVMQVADLKNFCLDTRLDDNGSGNG